MLTVQTKYQNIANTNYVANASCASSSVTHLKLCPVVLDSRDVISSNPLLILSNVNDEEVSPLILSSTRHQTLLRLVQGEDEPNNIHVHMSMPEGHVKLCRYSTASRNNLSVIR